MKNAQETETLQNEVDSTKRDFMKKFGVYASAAPFGMYMLMTPSASAHAGSSNDVKVEVENGHVGGNGYEDGADPF